MLRIFSTEETFKIRKEELIEDFLVPRGYSRRIIQAQLNRLNSLPGADYEDRRKKALEKVKKSENERIPAPYTFNPRIPNIGKVFRKHHNAMLTEYPELREVFPEPPMPALRQPPNLRRFICRATLYKPQTRVTRNHGGWRSCSKQCKVHQYCAPNTSKVTSKVTGYEHNIKSSVNCQSRNIIYLWYCERCKNSPNQQAKFESIYIGSSKRQHLTRMAEHLGYIRTKKLSEPAGLHFNKPNHSISDFKHCILEEVRSKDQFILRSRESHYIAKFDSFRFGLNKEP